MSKRNFILLIVILGIAVIAVFGFLYFRQGVDTGGETGEDTNFLSQFNPFGTSKTKTPAYVTPPADVSGYEPGPEENANVKLRKVSSMPVAGVGVFMKERLIDTTPPKTEFAPAVRYVERATGNIYQTFADKIEERKFSATIIPKVYDSYFGNKGQSVIMRYLKADDKTIETFLGALPKEVLGRETGDNEIKGSFLPEDVKDLSISPDTSKVFYLFESGGSRGDSMIGVILNFLDSKRVQIFDSPFTEWLSVWPNEKVITLTTKPSGSTPGYMYKMDSNGRNLVKILGGINGLTTLAGPSGKLILYGNNSLSLSIYNTDTRDSVALSVRTLPEKCVWSRGGDAIYCAVPQSAGRADYPDTWYQGEVSFVDQIWKINTQNGTAVIIANPSAVAGGEDIDGIKLTLDEQENHLFFVNKKDSFLWKLNLNQ